MKILIYGEDINWSMARNLSIEFNKLNISTTIFDFRDFFLPNSNIILKIFNRILKFFFYKIINRNFLKVSKKDNFDFILILKGLELELDTIKQLKANGNFLVNWSPDHYYNSLNSSKNLRSSLFLYNLIISPRTHIFDFYRNKGVKNLLHIDWYLNTNLQYPYYLNSSDLEYQCEISFIGNWSKKRENYLLSLKKYDVRIWGGGWKKASNEFKKKFIVNNPVFFPNMSRIVNTSKINLNFLTDENIDTSNFRNYELLASKSFQLTEYSDFLSQQFINDYHLSFFKSESDLISKIDYYLKNDQEREKIRDQGYKYSIENEFFSIQYKIKQILNQIRLIK